MFDIAPSELMLVGAVALVVIGPKDLPRAMRFVGQWVGRARGMARHFRMGLDEIVRQAELEEMQKKWAAENARIMAEHPMPPADEAHDATFAEMSTIAPAPLPATPGTEAEAAAPAPSVDGAVEPPPAIDPPAPVRRHPDGL